MTEREIFDRAQEIADPTERTAFVSKACGGDLELASHINEMLAAHEALGSFLEKPAGMSTDAAATKILPSQTAAGEAVGDVVAGKYKLLQIIGEGGMGVVYMAEQRAPIVRRVALKIIKPGLHSAEVLARFEAERQALAVMDHPHIARVFDAGTTEAGLPFFVMELVHGIPITRYCDEAQLSLAERLTLFVPVCQAVQHAHQKGVIHRDIKPSNVLVAQYDGKPVPKVIDFGVAKAVGQNLTERTLFTQFGAVVGTLEYMSPEQATLNALDVDTRSDIYSLGVLIYELLTGETPMDRQRLKRAAFDEVLRVIRCEEPPKPSTRLSSSARLPAIAAERRVEPRRLSSLVRGELDWIVMKALEKERDRRYDTAKDLAEDVERHLASQPVAAGPPSSWYRLRKFVIRNRVRLKVASLVAAILVLATCAVLWSIYREKRSLVLAAAEQKRAIEAQNKNYELRERTKQQQITLANLGKMFGSKGEFNAEAALQLIESGLPGDAGRKVARAMKLSMEGEELLGKNKFVEAHETFDKSVSLLKELPKPENDFGGAKSKTINIALSMAQSGRGQTLDQLHRDDEADQAWNEAILASPAEMRGEIQSQRLASLSEVGKHAKAIVLADQWSADPNAAAEILVAAAKIDAQAVADATAHDASQRRKQAILLLERAEKKGYFAAGWRRKDLANSPAWKPLRDASQFQLLLSRVSAAPPEKSVDAGKMLSGLNLAFAAGNSKDSAEQLQLLDQAMAQFESVLPQSDESMRLYLGVVRKALEANKLSQQGKKEEASAILDSADDMMFRLSKLPLSPQMPPQAMDHLRTMLKASRERTAQLKRATN